MSPQFSLRSRRLSLSFRAALAGLLLSGSLALAETKLPKAQFQPDYFGEMPRAFGVVQEVDTKGRTLLVKRDRDGESVRVAIKDDTELHFRDSWGELEDYFPGQHLMLFMYVDEDKQWTYPRAVQDDIHMWARHGHFARVTHIDAAAHVFTTHREEKNAQGQVTSSEDKEVLAAPDAKVWKGAAPAGFDALQVGDEVIQQLVEHDGKLWAAEIFDRKGDDAVRAAQDERHRRAQDRLGLTGYVTDLETLSGALTLTVAWSGAARAAELKPGDVLAITLPDGSKAFGGALISLQKVDSRIRLQMAANARVAARLAYGQSLRIFMPGTGPEIPSGRAGVPASAYK